MAWIHLIYICHIFIESLNPTDQSLMRLQENKDAGDVHPQRQWQSLPRRHM